VNPAIPATRTKVVGDAFRLIFGDAPGVISGSFFAGRPDTLGPRKLLVKFFRVAPERDAGLNRLSAARDRSHTARRRDAKGDPLHRSADNTRTVNADFGYGW